MPNQKHKQPKIMLIERTNTEVISRLPSYVDKNGLQRLVDYLTDKKASKQLAKK